MKVIVGLGNPGRKYENTRHNMGFITLDTIADRFRISVDQSRFKGLVGSGVIEGQKVLLVKPQTFMNLSGECVREVLGFYKIDPAEDLIVLYDDISLAPGQIRVRGKGSAGGHNGIKNIITHLGTQEFQRVKIGVGSKPEGWDLADFVLSHGYPDEQIAMREGCEKASRAAVMLLTEDIQRVMNACN